MVHTAFHSCAAPHLVVLAHPSSLPAPGGTPNPSTLYLHPHSTCVQGPSPRLCIAPLTHPSHLHPSLPRLHHPSFHAPSPCAWSPCVQASLGVWHPCAWPPLCGPPLACTPVPPALPECAQKDVQMWWGT